MTKTALIVEGHPLYRGALMQLMDAVVGESATVAASSAEEGLRLAEAHPDLRLILLDFGLPGVNGIEAILAFRRQCPSTPIMVESASEDRQEATAALRAGAKAFVSKAMSMEVMTDVAQRLLSGSSLAPEWMTFNSKNGWDGGPLLKLTPRQQEILELLSQGHSNKEIGLRLGLADITVKVHVSSVFRALNVVNRTQAVLAARRLGLHVPQQNQLDEQSPDERSS